MKKIFFLTILLFHLTFVFGQSVGSIVKRQIIYNSSGIVVSYTITYYGVGDCNNNTNAGLKKYRIDFNAKNNSNSTVKLVASRVDLDDNLGSQHYCRSGIYILFGSSQGFEDFGTLVPSENVTATEYVYMLQSSNDLPYVSFNIIPSFQKEQNPPKSVINQNANNTNSNSITTISNNNTINQNNNVATASNVNDEIKNLQRRQTIACAKLEQQGKPFSNRLCTEGFNGGLPQNDSDTKKWVIQLRSQVKELEQMTTYAASSQQNDLTEHNSSKAEMENKMQPNQSTQSQSNQVINTLPNNTNTEILNVLESTTNQITNSLSNSIEKSKGVTKNNELEIKNAQKEFQKNNLSDKEIDLLLANPDPANYATINIYKEMRCCQWYIFINGKNLPMMNSKNKKIEYRIYNSNELLLQYYATAGFATSPMKSFATRIRKSKTYHFIIKKVGMADFTIEQVDEEPIDKKGNKVYENNNQKIKSDIE